MVKVATCWDDGVCTDLRLLEILRKYNAKATFNLNPGLHGEERFPSKWVKFTDAGWSHNGFHGGKLSKNELTEVYKGFKVASHCMKHEAVGEVLDNVFLKAALDARHWLEDLFQQECPGFAWPNGATSQATADALREAGFEYGRTTANTDNVLSYEHPLLLNSSCHFLNRSFKDIFEKAKTENGVFYFWGHTYEMMDCQGMWDFTEQKIKFLSEDPEVEWIDVIDIVRMPR